MNISEAIGILDAKVPHPNLGLPDEIFQYISRTTPMINVDLLVKDNSGRTLFSWRDDPYSGKGWHLPGGIIRYKETIETRIQKVAEIEIGTPVNFKPDPIAVNQIIVEEKRIRAHFISLLFKCSIKKPFEPQNKGLAISDPGYLKWHGSRPDDLLSFHNIYNHFF